MLETGEGRTFLVSDRDIVALTGRVYGHIVSRLDGSRTAADLAHDLSGNGIGAAEVYYALDRLAARGVLASGRPSGATLDLLGEARRESEREAGRPAPAARPVHVIALSGAGTAVPSRLLGEAGFVPTGHAETASVVLVVTDDYLDPRISEVAHELSGRGTPHFLLKPSGSEIWVGPLLVPGETACYECLSQRLRAHRRPHEVLFRQTGRRPTSRRRPGGPEGALDPGMELAFLRAALDLRRWAAAREPDPPTVLTIDLGTGELRRHTLLRRPQCAACGDPDLLVRSRQEPPRMARRPKLHRGMSGHRDRDPEATLGELAHHVSDVTGVVRELRPVNGFLSGSIHAFSAGHNIALPARDWEGLRQNRREVSGGKGLTETQARVSAVCEAIERYCAAFHGDEPRVLARMEDLAGEAIHPGDCLGFSDRQYVDRARLNREASDWRSVIPAPFDESMRIEWTPVWSVSDGCRRYLPTTCCYLGYRHSDDARGTGDFGFADTNGAAAGNSLEEAMLQGTLELIERDAVSIWWYNRLRRPAVDIGSLGVAGLETLREEYRRLGRRLWLLDLTSDLHVPVIAAISVEEDERERNSVLLGFGAHLDPRVAAARAMTEINQILRGPAHAPGDGESSGPGRTRETHTWESVRMEEHPHLFPEGSGPCLLHDASSDDILQDVRHAAGLLAHRGQDLLVLELTRPDVGLPVVKMVSPGLRHFWPRFGPGRLYDVPVRMGWLPQPLDEGDLNPRPVFF